MSPYETLTGRKVDVRGLSAPERRVLTALLREFRAEPDADAFAGSWTRKVIPRVMKLPAEARTAHPLYVIGQDLELRLGIAQGTVAPPDYRDYLLERIEEKFGSRYKFCQATGIPQAALSQVLSGQKDFSLGRLQEIAEALDLGLALLPLEELAATRAAGTRDRGAAGTARRPRSRG
jgi:transcriptional regulator with XRE-family HTH domain